MEKKYKVRVANTDKKRKEGLLGVTELARDEGMLFEFDEPGIYTITTKGMIIPIDVVYLTEDDIVLEVHIGLPNAKDITNEKPASKVLEVNSESKIKIGDTIKYDFTLGKDMEVLDENGKTQMYTEGNERIFSRIHTKQLIKLAKKAETDKDFVELAMELTTILNTQDNQEQQFVQI